MFLKDSSVYEGPFDLRQGRKNGFVGPIRAQIGQKHVKIVDLHKKMFIKVEYFRYKWLLSTLNIIINHN